MHLDKPIKQLFNRQHNWLKYLDKHLPKIRQVVIENVTKMLNYGSVAFCSKECCCSHGDCTHRKYIHQTCSHAFAAVVVSKPLSGGYAYNTFFPIVNTSTSRSLYRIRTSCLIDKLRCFLLITFSLIVSGCTVKDPSLLVISNTDRFVHYRTEIT